MENRRGATRKIKEIHSAAPENSYMKRSAHMILLLFWMRQSGFIIL